MRLSEVALVNRPTTSLVDAWPPGFPIPEIERGPWHEFHAFVTQPGASFLYASATSKPYPRIDIRRARRTHIADTTVRHTLGPFRRNQIRTALRTLID
jgi:hypothetical protein